MLVGNNTALRARRCGLTQSGLRAATSAHGGRNTLSDVSTRSEHQGGAPTQGSAAVKPADIRGLIRKADAFAEAGDARSASAFYGAALRAATPPGSVPPDLAADLRRAQEMYAHYRTRCTTYLRDQLAATGFDPERSSSRFAQSVDIVLGERRIFVQEPRYY